MNIQEIVNRYDTAPKNIPVLFGTPKKLSKKFRWDKKTVMGYGKMQKQLTEFCNEHPKMNLDPKWLLMILKEASKTARNDFDILYPNEKIRPNYHNPDHTMLTAVEGLKIFLGGLSELKVLPPDKTKQFIEVAVNVMARHEQDDWWDRKSKNVLRVTNNTKTLCKKLGISFKDFKQMITLDTFNLTLEQCLDNMLKKTEQSDFLWLGKNAETRKTYLTLLGQSLRSSDFMQIFNPGYYKNVKIVGESFPKNGIKTNLGPVALAFEFKLFRPNAAKSLGWLDDNREIVWEEVKVDENFIRDYALPNIKPGINYLKIFNENEGKNVELIVKALEKNLLLNT